jgi:hypothetical protein
MASEVRANRLAAAAERRAAAALRRKTFRAEYEKRPKVAAYRASYKARPERRAAARARQSEPDRQEARAAYHRKRRATDPNFLLHGRMSCLIRSRLRSGKQGRSWSKLVDYSLDELRAHIERQFLPGMSWANAREWHIDHIIPASAFQYTTTDDVQFRRCWALTNLRPLWRLDNIKKSNKVQTLL